MSAQSLGAPLEAPAHRASQPPAATRRTALLAVVVLVTSVVGFAPTPLYPETDADGQFTYAVVEPAREHFWAWLVVGPATSSSACARSRSPAGSSPRRAARPGPRWAAA